MSNKISTIDDVAALALVSKATVSRVLNGTAPVNKATKFRVHEAMKSLHFTPNTLARSMRSGKTYTVGIIIPDYSNIFYSNMHKAIEQRLSSAGFMSIICPTQGREELEKKYLSDLVKRKVDGILYFSYNLSIAHSKELEELSTNIPMVLMDESSKDFNISCVYTDGYAAFYKMTKHLIKAGHRRIAFLDPEVIATDLRISAYKDALCDAGIAVEKELIIPVEFSMTSGNDRAQNFLAIKNRPTAIISAADYPAIGMVSALVHAGINIPQDVEVFSFDNIELSQLLYPHLTTVAQPVELLAQKATEILLDKIQCKEKIKEVVKIALVGEEIFRETTKNISID